MKPIKLVKDEDVSMMDAGLMLTQLSQTLTKLNDTEDDTPHIYELTVGADLFTVGITVQKSQMRIDIHKKIAFDELMKELNKLKDLNNLVDAYKENIDKLSLRTNELSRQIEIFYNKAKEHNDQVNLLYQKYVDGTREISESLDRESRRFNRMATRNTWLSISILIILVLSNISLILLLEVI